MNVFEQCVSVSMWSTMTPDVASVRPITPFLAPLHCRNHSSDQKRLFSKAVQALPHLLWELKVAFRTREGLLILMNDFFSFHGYFYSHVAKYGHLGGAAVRSRDFYPGKGEKNKPQQTPGFDPVA